MNRITTALTVGVLTIGFTACGDDDGGGGGDSEAKSAIIDDLMADQEAFFDRDCIATAVNGLSDADADFIVANIEADEAYIANDPPDSVFDFASDLFDCLPDPEE